MPLPGERAELAADAAVTRLGIELRETRRERDAAREARAEARAERDEALQAVRAARDEALAEARAERDEALEAAERRLGELRSELEQARARLLEMEASRAELVAAHTAELDALRQERAQQASEPARDDLTQLKGIGPKFAKLLAAAGVTRFAQLAEWDDAEVERVAAILGIRPGRVRRDGWVEQARRLQDEA